MIRIKTIHIEEFRGIKILDLDLNCNSFGICGPNGSGKSGVVDAIEFCLTGKITRLSGEGSGQISIKEHAPHVDHRKNPEKAKVTITAIIPSLGKEVEITRCVKDSHKAKITPNNDEVKTVIKEMQLHSEFVLSRREIAEFIIIRPTERSKAVQKLLRLEYIDNLRDKFVKCRNKCRRECENAESVMHNAEESIKNALSMNFFDQKKLLEKVNEQRGILDLYAFDEINPKIPFKEGKITEKNEDRKPDSIVKVAALGDIEALTKAINIGEPNVLKEHRENTSIALEKLQKDKKELSHARMHGFIATGINFVTEDMCPLCDEAWDADKLREHLKRKLSRYKEINTSIEKLNKMSKLIITCLQERLTSIQKVAEHGAKLNPIVPRTEFDAYISTLENAKSALVTFQDDGSQIERAFGVIQEKWWEMPVDAQRQLDEIHRGVEALPDSSDADNASSFLNILQDRYRNFITTQETVKIKEKQFSIAEKVVCHYGKVSNKILEDIYANVSGEFTKFYRIINDDDEGQFSGEMQAENSKLNLNVDFFNRGFFPPSAYHSEGHQDGMGLCLYLALMKHTFGNGFVFAVLDDVLISVDTGHRRKVSKLLRNEFPNTQFILTTHDSVWFNYMKTKETIKKGCLFSGWNVNLGPRMWDDEDIWTEIDTALDENNVPHAASTLRRYLEYILSLLADKLHTPIRYKENANYDLGDLLFPVMDRWLRLLQKGIKSAKSWDKDESQLIAKQKEAKALDLKIREENRAINQLVHFNEWANFTSKEFKVVVDAFKAWLNHIRCSNPECGDYPCLVISKGAPDHLICRCFDTKINLEIK